MTIRVAELYVVAAFLPVFTGLRRVRTLNTGQRALCAWVVLSALLNAAQVFLGERGQSTVWLTIVTYPVFAIVALEALGRLSETPWFLNSCRAVAFIYALAWMGANWTLEDHHWFSSYTGPMLWVTLTLAAAGLIVVRFSSERETSFSEPAILAGIATLLSYAPMVALEPASKALYAKHSTLVLTLWETRAALLIVGVVLYNYALKWTPRQTS